MNLLIIGGGKFVGRATAEAALARGHSVTVFNRGKTTTEVISGVEWIKGDRDGDLAELGGKSWDAVIDVCAYYPRHVESLLKALKGRIGHYTLVSTIAVYANFAEPDRDETSPVLSPIDGAPETFTSETYGPFKVMCEKAALEFGPASMLFVRPGVIVGPNDPTGRFSYWVQRIAAGGKILVPGSPVEPLQVIDARDLALWMVEKTEARTVGFFNTIGPRHPLTWSGMFETATLALGAHVEPAWVGDAFIDEQKVAEKGQLPLYISRDNPRFRYMFSVSGQLAFGSGLKLRPLSETIKDTLVWLRGPHSADAKTVGLSRELEAQLLVIWNARTD